MASDKYTAGLDIRRKVMGEQHVDNVMDNTDNFMSPLQDYINENCWGSVWTRDVLPYKTRSLITIAMLAALKCPTELKGHIRGALRNGCTIEEIQEVLLQSAVYCGAPAAIEAFRAAGDAIENWKE